MKVFSGPAEFVSFLEKNPEVKELIAWSEDLVAMDKNIHKGCKCREKLRVKHRDNTYRDLVVTVIGLSRPLQSVLREYLQEDEIKFKIGEEIILEF